MSKRSKLLKRQERERLKRRKMAGLPAKAEGSPPSRHDASSRIEQVRFERRELTASAFFSPIPPPEILAGYEGILAGSANRILTMAENQSAHRQKMETKVTDNDVLMSRLGLACAFALGLIGLVGGSYVETIVKNGAGAAIAGTSLAGLTWVFVYGTYTRRQERTERAKLMTKQEEPKKKG